MKKKLYLHIGFGKTGTSAIQALFSKNRNDLLKQGFLYPKTGVVGHVHHGLAPLGADKMDETTKLLFEQLKQEISDSQSNTVIISTEHFTFAKPSYIEDVQRAFAAYSAQVIFYVRVQETLIESTFLQWQKVGADYSGGIEHFFKKHKAGFNFMNVISPWARYFGEKSIIARVYDRKLIGDDVCRDIISIIGIEGLVPGAQKKENVSLRPEFSTLIGLLDSAGVNKEDRPKIINELLQLSERFNSIKKESLIFSDLKKEILAFYRESNQEFSEKYLAPKHAVVLCNTAQTSGIQAERTK